MTLLEQCTVIQAAIDGKRLQYRDETLIDQPWLDALYPVHSSCRFDFQRTTWRIAPEPREWWAIVSEPFDGQTGRLFPTQARAMSVSEHYNNKSVRVIKVREVLDEGGAK